MGDSRKSMNKPTGAPPNTYLEFSRIEDYLKHLKTYNIKKTHGELNVVIFDSGLDKSSEGVYAVLTSSIQENHIATCGVLICNFEEKKNPEEHPNVNKAFSKIKELLSEEGLEVLPGIWKYEAPIYLN